jgi:hypothetical protein
MAKTSLRVRVSPQLDAYSAVPADSMNYILLLNGVCHPVRDSSRDISVCTPRGCGPIWLLDCLERTAPSDLPGPDGPISLVLIL